MVLRMVKKIIIIVFAFTLCIETFASIVSDNDGSAFITKAEFEAMKKDFNDQIEQYNESISSKIDGAIASYLAGTQLARKENRKQIISGAKHWLMYNTNDYPKYVDGKPYVAGFTAQGNRGGDDSTGRTCIWVGIIHNGQSAYKTDGGFKKHIVGKPSKNSSLNGNDNYVAEWQGYYTKEGEILTLSSFQGDVNSGVWAAKQQDRLRWMSVTSFSNNDCPVTVGDIRFTNNDGTYWTGLTIKCSGAQRKIGEMVGDTYVSVYKNISDNRFWDSTIVNKVGITPTSPAITYTAQGSTFASWMQSVMPTNTINFACSNRYYTSSGSSSGWRVNNSDGCFGKTVTVTTIIVNNASYNHYLFKMANDSHDLQFVRLWSGITDSIAQALNKKREDVKTSENEKEKIKNALLFDGDCNPHLSMGAGYPFLEVKLDEEVEFEFKIKESGNYLVFAKYGPFSATGDAATEADVIFKSGTDTTYPKAFKATGGDVNNKFKFTATESNYIFLKWCDASTLNNGGTMDVSVDPIVTLVQ